jgi:hypothetical protein
MEQFNLKVNGRDLGICQGKAETTREDFIRFIAEHYNVQVDVTKDTLEIIRVTEKLGQSAPFRTNAYMQVSHFAVDLHLNNLIATYGLDVVMGRFDKLVGTGRAA